MQLRLLIVKNERDMSNVLGFFFSTKKSSLRNRGLDPLIVHGFPGSSGNGFPPHSLNQVQAEILDYAE
jgi:hypothetical protein